MFKKMLIAATAALSVGGAMMAAAAPADAAPRGWHGGWRGPGRVFAAGVLGVAIGESLANPYYGAPPAYYAGPGYWGYYEGCRAYWRWEPRFGRYVRVDRCY